MAERTVIGVGAIVFALLSVITIIRYPELYSSQQKTALKQENAPWNLYYHLGGYGPYVSKVDGIVTNTSLPEECQVDQIHMLARHSERYPTVTAGLRMLDLHQRLAKVEFPLNGSLKFANHWSFFTSDPRSHFEQLTTTGPYAGSKNAFNLGVALRTEYDHLRLLALAANDTRVTFWASDSERVIDTAKYFAAGFFGLDWQQDVNLNIIPETSDQGANTLTPGETCVNYESENNDAGWNYGSLKVNDFKNRYSEKIRQRLLQESPGLLLYTDDINAMQELCGFETMARGSSRWCDVFSEEDWLNFEYARDMLHYYRSGPGNTYAATMGWLWLNATANLLEQGPSNGPLFLSFVHDGDIFPMLAALELFPQTPDLPTSHVLHHRTWRTSDMVPMGANIIFERLACKAPQECWSNAPMYPNHVYCTPPHYDVYIRIKVNGGIVALPGCDSGVGQSCPLEDFVARVKRRGQEVGNFAKVCGLADNVPKNLDFLHQ